MDRIDLADTGRATSRLGFGTGRLLGGRYERESRALLDAALDAGITHFDTAAMYGEGTAEAVVGRFLQQHRDEVTVATKYGLTAGGVGAGARLRTSLRMAARPIVRAVPTLRSTAQRAAGRMGGGAKEAPFTADEARASLEESLRALRTDHVDLFLMHAASADALDDPNLLVFLETAVASGHIGSFGVGSEWQKIDALLRRRPAFCRVLQFEWLPFGGPDVGNAFRIHHGAVAHGLSRVQEIFERAPELRVKWSHATDNDLSNPETLSGLLLRAALDANPDCVILFFSRHARRIRANAAAAVDPALAAPADRLIELMRRSSVDDE